MSGRSWYIDSIDVRAGRTFASFREPDLLRSDSIDEKVVTFFFEPPDFGGIQVSRATAFGAQRVGFQAGLFDNDGEVPFASLDELAEFLRRAYLRHGGGGPGGEVEGGEPPSGPVGPAGGEGIDDRLHGETVSRFKSISGEFEDGDVARGASKPLDFSNLLSAVERPPLRYFHKLIEVGAKLVLCSEFSRVMEMRGKDRYATDFSVFLRALSLSRCMLNIRDLDRMLHDALRSYPDWRKLVERELGWWEWSRFSINFVEENPVEVLAEISLSRMLNEKKNLSSMGCNNLQDLLYFFLAAPQIFSIKSRDFGRIVSLVAFCSACVVAPSSIRRSGMYHLRWRLDRYDSHLTRNAAKWLEENLPKRMYSSDVEGLLIARIARSP